MFVSSLGSLPFLSHGRSRSITMENPRGEKGAGGKASGILGPSRKGAAALRGFKAGETFTVAEIEGPGIINHIWMTLPDKSDTDYFVLRDVVLRMYWDDETNPSVEVPIGDFFCNGFGEGCLVNSLPIAVNPTRGFNSYFQMPFRKHARITVENQHPVDVRSFFYQVDYTLYDELPENSTYFHAQWRREKETQLRQDYVILDNIQGKGAYIGTYMAISTLQRYWWGEGEFKFFIDGDTDYPTICGTGMEDYFGGAWGFVIDQRKETPAFETTYQTPFLGYPFYSSREQNYSWRFEGDCPPMRGLYRWHLMDPILFDSDLKVTAQQIGTCNTGLFERQDDVSTVAYWYQTEPHNTFPTLPSRTDRLPR